MRRPTEGKSMILKGNLLTSVGVGVGAPEPCPHSGAFLGASQEVAMPAHGPFRDIATRGSQ